MIGGTSPRKLWLVQAIDQVTLFIDQDVFVVALDDCLQAILVNLKKKKKLVQASNNLLVPTYTSGN